MKRIYRRPSPYAPALIDNARVLAHLLGDFDHDLWHFVFAPNPMSSRAGAWIRTIRRRPVIQTVASQPRSFEGVKRLLFGDHIVVLSHHTAKRLRDHGAQEDRITVIPPPIADIARDGDARKAARTQVGIGLDAPLFVYAGDLEFSLGSTWMAAAVPKLLRDLPDAVVAFACRAKTQKAALRRERLSEQLARYGDHVRFLGEVQDLPALIASATAAPFVVDDLYGKVDLPYVVLEAALLEVPVVVLEGSPLAEIEGIPTMGPGDGDALARWCVEMSRDDGARSQLGATLRQSVRKRHDPRAVAERVESIYQKLLR
jgi:glycosyltransferase involved in cell wall biosynthesis